MMRAENDKNLLLMSSRFKKQKEYWLGKLYGCIGKTEILFNNDRKQKLQKTQIIQKGKQIIEFQISRAIYSHLMKLSKQSDLSIYIVLLTGLKSLIYRYTSKDDIIVLSPIYQFNISGETINSCLFIRDHIPTGMTFKELILGIRESLLQAYENQDYPYDQLIASLFKEAREKDYNTISNITCSLRNIHHPRNIEEINTTLSFSFERKKDRITACIRYDPETYEQYFIEQMSNHFINILEKAIENIDIKISEPVFLSQEEQKRLIGEFNDTAAAYPEEKTIHELFEEQVERTPDHMALIWGDKQVTYKKLNEKSNQLAGKLRGKGVKSETIAGIMVNPSKQMMVGILGILKAGGAYLPIDPQYPGERVKYILEDSGINFLLTGKEMINYKDFPGEIIDITDEETYGRLNNNLSKSNTSKDLAYVIYTSGTTGKPKGVMIEHRNVVRLMINDRFLFDFSMNDVWTLFHSYCFDFSVWEMYGAWLYGGKLIIIPKMVARDTRRFLEILKKNNVTILNQTPSAFYHLITEEVTHLHKELTLRYIIFGGEALKPVKLREWKNRYPEVKLINMFGITETTVHVTYKELTDEEIKENISNVGKPIPTSSTYVMDNQQRLLPIGVEGELSVGGEGPGRGYLNQLELTKEKLVRNPYNPGERLYKSGDLVRLTPEGEIIYLGRIDHQVQLRGFRIELGEIENQLLKHDRIKEAVVTKKENEKEDKYLCAYIVSDGEYKGSELREYLLKKMPDYMVPSYFVQLEKIPLTPNGKIDKKALPNPGVRAGDEYIPPKSKLQKKLVEIWSETLNINEEVVGIDSSFFNLGGHSLKATVLANNIRKTLQVNVPLADIFKNSTIRELAKYIEEAEGNIYALIKAVEKKEYHRLSSAQKRLYILQQIEKDNTSYNMPAVQILEGDISREHLENIFMKLIERHESLRTSFHLINNEPIQKIHSPGHVEFEIEYDDLQVTGASDRCRWEEVPFGRINAFGGGEGEPAARSPQPAAGLINSFIRPFDLSRAPLLRVGMIKTGGTSYILMLDIHHIIVDAVSHEILVQDFILFYKGESLSPLRIHYKDFSDWQNSKEQQELIKHMETYWLNLYADELPVLRLPTDFPRPEIQSSEGSTLSFRLNETGTNQLIFLAKKANTTLYTCILAIFNILLAKLGRQEDIIVGIPLAGRNHPGIEPIVGMFVNTLAIRSYPSREKTFIEFLNEVRQRTLEAFENQEYPFEDLVDKISVSRDTSRNPIFDVMLLFQEIAGPGSDTLESEKLKVSTYNFERKRSQFDLSLRGTHINGKLHFLFTYCTKLFTKKTLELFAACFKNLLRQIIASADRELNAYYLLSGTEQELYNYLELSEQEIEGICPLPPPLQDIYGECTINPNDKVHRMIFYYIMNETINIEAWKESLTILHRIYPVLRAKLVSKGEQVYFAIKRACELDFEYMDLAGEAAPKNNIEETIKEITSSLTHNLEQGLIKHYLIKVSADLFINILTVHHIISDGVTPKILSEKLHEIYGQILAGDLDNDNGEIKSLHVFNYYQQFILEKFDTRAVKNYWEEKFANVRKPQRSAYASVSNKFVSHRLLIKRDHLEKIQTYCRCLDIPVSLYFKALYGLLIRFHFSIEEDFTTREIFDVRDEITQDWVGCFCHTIPFVFQQGMFSRKNTLAQYFRMVSALMMEMKEKANISIHMQNQLLSEEGMTFYYHHQDFLKFTISKRDYYLNPVWEYSDNYSHPTEVRLLTWNVDQGYFLELNYNEAFFNGERFLEWLHYVSQQVVEGVKHLKDLNFLPGNELRQILAFSNGTPTEFPSRTPLFKLFQQQAAKKPGRIAVGYQDRRFTYNRLNEISNRLAHYLRDNCSIKPDQTVGVLLDRSPLMMQSILAAWKAGGAYIPLEPQYPSKRVLQILNDSGTPVLLTRSEFVDAQLQAGYNGQILLLDKHGSRWENLPVRNPDLEIDRQCLAYVIYTSGSTGKPKGAMVEHIGMMNHIQAKINDLQATEESVVAQNASHTFDISVWQFFMALSLGGKTFIYPNKTILDPRQLISQLVKHRVTILEVVPSYLSVILALPGKVPGDFPALRYLLVTGETVNPDLVRRWFEKYPGVKMVNAYGPTEASDDITHYIMDKKPHLERIPIGSPLQNLKIYIVDKNMKLCPIGCKGEICVAGVGVGRGYLNDGEKTGEVFMEDPYGQEMVRLYKTGDLGCWLPDGNIDFFGRKDYQVKIRGVRIELGEIENQILKYPGVKEVVVLDKQDKQGNKQLYAYVSTNGDLSLHGLKKYLSETLPPYMIPAYVMEIDSIPLTVNGKVDRQALPELAAIEKSTLPYVTVAMLKNPGGYQEISLMKEEPGDGGIIRERIITEDEHKEILHEFNKTIFEYPREKLLHQLFEEQVEKRPGHIALVYKNGKLTYHHLNERANQLARLLRTGGVGPDCVVGVMTKPSLELMIGLLGVLKAGGGYMPIEPEYPKERIKFMLADSSTDNVLTHENLADHVNFKGNILTLDESQLYPGEGINLTHVNTPGDLLHMLYTSGTTGKPKGVLISHRNMVNYIHWFSTFIRITPEDKTMLNSSFAYDLCYSSLYSSVLVGGELHILPVTLYRDPDGIIKYIRNNELTFIKLTPSHYSIIVNSPNFTKEASRKIRLVCTCGEEINLKDIERTHDICEHIEVMNHYGPSECTTGSVSLILDFSTFDHYKEHPTIGRPVFNTQAYIVDSDFTLLPVGVVGELCISGDGIARGYSNRPDLSKEKFISNPFQKKQKMYRTGDLARWRPDGTIEFLGRKDHQVKIKGYRIELSEIENQLLKSKEIKEAVIMVNQHLSGDKYLSAFLVSDKALVELEIKELLSRELPAYMIPSYFVQLERMPLTPNGKVDRRALPDPINIINMKRKYVAPKNKMETKIVEIWSDVLEIEPQKISVEDNFFELGGNSLLIIKVNSKLREETGKHIPVVKMFRYPTVLSLSQYLGQEKQEETISDKPIFEAVNVMEETMQLFIGNEDE